MKISGSFTLSISDPNLDFKDIERNIGIQPTKLIKKGQLLTKLESRKAPYDIWLYEIKVLDEGDVLEYLAKLLKDLLPYSKYIQKISKCYDQVTINCYLRSDFAQMGFEITYEIINMLQKLSLGINFHILSFGRVED